METSAFQLSDVTLNCTSLFITVLRKPEFFSTEVPGAYFRGTSFLTFITGKLFGNWNSFFLVLLSVFIYNISSITM